MDGTYRLVRGDFAYILIAETYHLMAPPGQTEGADGQLAISAFVAFRICGK